MSIFKLSGNMALGGNNYPQEDLSEIKNSLRLLKAKQANKRNYDIPDNNVKIGLFSMQDIIIIISIKEVELILHKKVYWRFIYD